MSNKGNHTFDKGNSISDKGNYTFNKGNPISDKGNYTFNKENPMSDKGNYTFNKGNKLELQLTSKQLKGLLFFMILKSGYYQLLRVKA